jgi:hypothetical protein
MHAKDQHPRPTSDTQAEEPTGDPSLGRNAYVGNQRVPRPAKVSDRSVPDT